MCVRAIVHVVIGPVRRCTFCVTEPLHSSRPKNIARKKQVYQKACTQPR